MAGIAMSISGSLVAGFVRLAILAPVIVGPAAGVDESLKRTLPAYALAVDSGFLNSSTCEKQLGVFREAVDDRKLWGLKMLDSSGEPKPGFIYGNNYWLGSRSQCQDASNRVPLVLVEREKRNNSRFRNIEEEFPPFELNYFVAHFRHNSTLQYHVRLPNEASNYCFILTSSINKYYTLMHYTRGVISK
ncbi:uncharacterized protein LOC111673871 [Orussus abietinus]|uniref:uncharacterized protein LOC111673871 n=1 Tax=Orussus abietinus TaxID=222816 RepID=UPI000C715BF7|nr:uncharacterized protein LOC111673871 [Orussus abietinus]